MADRFYSEGSKNNGAAGSDANVGSPKPQSTNPYSKIPVKPLGDFSENIDSNNIGKRVSQPQKRFEVHISDFDDFAGMPEPPASPKAPTPISQTQPVKRPVPPTAPRNRVSSASAEKKQSQMQNESAAVNKNPPVAQCQSNLSGIGYQLK